MMVPFKPAFPVDLLLVNPGDKKRIYQGLERGLSAVEPPVWAGLMASFIRRKGMRVLVLDASAEGLGPEETAGRIAEIAPILVAVVVYGQNPSASTMVMPAAGAICTAIKQISPAQPLLLVGGHVAALPERTLREEEADFVCDGEGPVTILELLRELKGGGRRLERVPGLFFRCGEGIVRTGSATLVEDLDSDMPSPAWDLLPMEKYQAHNWHCFAHLDRRSPYASLYTSLGCPFHCHFCCIQAPFRTGERTLGCASTVNSYRMWSPEAVVSQIDTLVNTYGVKNIKFADEIFVLNKAHVTGICDLIIQRDYKLNIWAYARVDSWSDDLLAIMKRAGINWLALGIESGSDRVRKDVRKGFRQDDAIRAVEAIKRAGIYIIGNYLFGLPEDDSDSMQETLDLALELNCEFANFYCVMAYPGSVLYDRAVKANLPLPETWAGYSQHGFETLPLPSRYLSGAEILRFRDQAFLTYFSDPGYLDMIRRTFGPRVCGHIKEMTSHRLERKYAQSR